MAIVLASNILSPLGMTTEENYRAVKAGRSSLRRYDGLWGLPEPFTASLFSDGQRRDLAIDGMTLFESFALRSARAALREVPLDLPTERTVFILSTTKANGEQLTPPGMAARRIASKLGFTTEPIVVCNACISGVAAIILAQRLLDGGQYDYAVVCGTDVQSRFTVSGFQSLKAVSADDCRPFDMERMGLNLGEGAATMVMGRSERDYVQMNSCGIVECGAIRNDAFHLSSPSKNGEGAWLALGAIDAAADRLAFINAHGTATMFNDQMESVAIERAGLAGVPVNGLKGYYGHMLGAAGIVETVISLAAIRDHTILATRGFEERGVSGKIAVTTTNEPTEKTAFVKMISGFGGGNAAIKVDTSLGHPRQPGRQIQMGHVTHRVTLSPSGVTVDGKQQPVSPDLTALYKQFVGDYPKFYKMDGLSRLGFIATELLLQAEADDGNGGTPRFTPRDDRALVFFNRSSSVVTDRKYLETIADDNFFPSPSLFVYTLPNIVTGEIALRNQYHGETSFFVLAERHEGLMHQVAEATCQDASVHSLVTGWLDYNGETDYEADLVIVSGVTPLAP